MLQPQELDAGNSDCVGIWGDSGGTQQTSVRTGRLTVLESATATGGMAAFEAQWIKSGETSTQGLHESQSAIYFLCW